MLSTKHRAGGGHTLIRIPLTRYTHKAGLSLRAQTCYVSVFLAKRQGVMMAKFLKIIVAGTTALFVGLAGWAAIASPPSQYKAGQVWAYKTRTKEAGSLLKIQRIGPSNNGSETVYHISLIGLKIGSQSPQTALPHLPVSQKTLDNSVTTLQRTSAAFPAPDEGIEIWQEDQGGIFTIPVAEILDVIEQSLSSQNNAPIPSA